MVSFGKVGVYTPQIDTSYDVVRGVNQVFKIDTHLHLLPTIWLKLAVAMEPLQVKQGGDYYSGNLGYTLSRFTPRTKSYEV